MLPIIHQSNVRTIFQNANHKRGEFNAWRETLFPREGEEAGIGEENLRVKINPVVGDSC